jgi:hypothetical protein
MSDSKPSIQPQNDAVNPNGQRHTMAGCPCGFTPNGTLAAPQIMTIPPTSDGGGRMVEKSY